MEIAIGIGMVIAVLWILWGSTYEADDPIVKNRKQRIASMYDVAERRYTNVVQDDGTVQTVRDKMAGKSSGTGSGGAASDKS